MWVRLIPWLFLLAACQVDQTPGDQGKALFKKEKKVRVEVYSVVGREIPLSLKPIGKTVLSDRFEAKAPAAVKVQKVFVEEGDHVTAGDPLVKFEDEESRLRLEKVKDEAREAEAGLEEENFMQTNRDRLIEEGKLSALEAEGIDEKVSLYQATLERTKSETELLENLLENTQINSPISGIVSKKGATEGSTVEEGDLLVAVVRTDPIHFAFTIPLDVAETLEHGSEMAVLFPTLKEREIIGTVLSIGTEVAEGGGGVEVKLSLPNETGFLKAQMSGEVRLPTEVKQKVFAVPPQAIVRSDHSESVYQVKEGKVRRVPVERGGDDHGQPILTKGVGEGDRVAISNLKNLKDGLAVEIETQP